MTEQGSAHTKMIEMAGQCSVPDREMPLSTQTTEALSFASVYEEHFAFVWRTARRLGIPTAVMDDVVQEVFVAVHRRLDEHPVRASLKGWLFGIVRNVVRVHKGDPLARHPRAFRREAGLDPDALKDPAQGPDDKAAKMEAIQLLERVLQDMDDDKREVFVLAELEQMSAPEIARAIHLPLNTVYSRLRLARVEFAAAAARYRARDQWRVR